MEGNFLSIMINNVILYLKMSVQDQCSIPNKREYKKLLSFGEFQQIYDSFGEKIYEKALTYIAKK